MDSLPPSERPFAAATASTSVPVPVPVPVPVSVAVAVPFAERAGRVDEARRDAVRAVLEEAARRELAQVRVSFADQHGLLRTKTLAASELSVALAEGVGITGSLLAKDTGNQFAAPLWAPSGLASLDAVGGAADVVMLPDPTTFRVLPWAEATGWLLCDLFDPVTAEPVPLSTRHICRQAEAALAGAGYRLRAGLELELHLFGPDGQPVHPGWDLLGEQHADVVAPLVEPLRAGLVALGLPPRSVEVELGPGQIELTFGPGVGTEVADQAVLVKAAIRQLARRHGMTATFMCRPAGPDRFPSGWHLHQSLLDGDGRNVFVPSPGEDQPLPAVGRQWVAGLLDHAAASCLLTTPTVNGYKRYRPGAVAPDRIAWATQSRGAMLRVVGRGAGDPATHVENRVGDPAANPYLYLTSQFVSGLAGLVAAAEPPPPTSSPYTAEAGPRLPASLGEAIEAFAASELMVTALGSEVHRYLLMLKRSEWRRFEAAVTDWEQREYFTLF